MTKHSNEIKERMKKQSSFHFRFQTQKNLNNPNCIYVKKEWIKNNNNNPESLDKQWNDKYTKRTREKKDERKENGEIKIQNQKVIGCIDSWK